MESLIGIFLKLHIENKAAAAERERAEGPPVPDRVMQARRLACWDADFVVVAGRRKKDWNAGTVVCVGSHGLRVAELYDIHCEGRLRTCYPLKLIRDGQIDRCRVFYKWPNTAPPLPQVPKNDNDVTDTGRMPVLLSII